MSWLISQRFKEFVDKVLDFSDSVAGIDVYHRQVHLGRSYIAEFIQENLANDGVVLIKIRAGSRAAHLNFAMTVTGKFIVKTYDGATYSNDGTPADGVQLTQVNRIVGSPDTGTAVVTYAPTVAELGPLRAIYILPGGTGPQSVGATGGSSNEIILLPDQDFLVSLENKSGQAKDIDFNFDWYEV